MKPIWIVDDDPSIRFVLEKALGREGWPIRSFTQARDVLKALADVDASDPERQGPQVLVSDIRMPGGSGLELLEQVRALEKEVAQLKGKLASAQGDELLAHLP